MRRKLTKAEIDFLQNLLKDEGIKGKLLLERFLLRNTYEPKYKIGDFVSITDDTASYIWGNRIVNVNAKVVELYWSLCSTQSDYCIQYKLECIDQDNKTHTLFAEENLNGSYTQRHINGLSNTDKNVFTKKSRYSQSTSL